MNTMDWEYINSIDLYLTGNGTDTFLQGLTQ